MNPLRRPDALARHLEENAAAWRGILGEVDPLALGILGRLEALARTWAELHGAVLAPFGLNYAELSTIGMLRTSPPGFRRSPTELRQLVGQTSAGMTRILTKLAARGLVRRTLHEEDARRLDVALTPRGARLAERSFAALHAEQGSLLAGCDARRRGEILRGLDDLLGAFAERPAAKTRQRERVAMGPPTDGAQRDLAAQRISIGQRSSRDTSTAQPGSRPRRRSASTGR